MNNQVFLGIEHRNMTPASQWNTLLLRVAEHQDKTAFIKLFEHYSPLLKSFLLKNGGVSAEEAEELVQETMIKVWRKSGSFSPKHASANTWIYTIARNTRIDWFRKQQREDVNNLHADDLYAEQESPSPHATLVQFRRSKQVSDQLCELPPIQSEVLKMMYMQGLSGQQIADKLSIPLGTVKSRVRLALAKLKVGLAPNATPTASTKSEQDDR